MKKDEKNICNNNKYNGDDKQQYPFEFKDLTVIPFHSIFYEINNNNEYYSNLCDNRYIQNKIYNHQNDENKIQAIVSNNENKLFVNRSSIMSTVSSITTISNDDNVFDNNHIQYKNILLIKSHNWDKNDQYLDISRRLSLMNKLTNNNGDNKSYNNINFLTQTSDNEINNIPLIDNVDSNQSKNMDTGYMDQEEFVDDNSMERNNHVHQVNDEPAWRKRRRQRRNMSLISTSLPISSSSIFVNDGIKVPNSTSSIKSCKTTTKSDSSFIDENINIGKSVNILLFNYLY